MFSRRNGHLTAAAAALDQYSVPPPSLSLLGEAPRARILDFDTLGRHHIGNGGHSTGCSLFVWWIVWLSSWCFVCGCAFRGGNLAPASRVIFQVRAHCNLSIHLTRGL